MANYNWGMINNGPIFQSLCSQLLAFEYPSIVQFGNPGPDGSIDIWDPNSKTVYQCKYHQVPKNSKTKSDALTEINNITKNRQFSQFSDIWSKAEKWVLITNIEKNPQLNNIWKTEIKDEFIKIDLNVDIYGIEDLKRLLIKHPEVSNVFFEDQQSTFLPIQEAINNEIENQIYKNSFSVSLYERDPELVEFNNFIESPDKKVMLVYGPGGIGRTRLLFEFAKKILNDAWGIIYWSNITTFEGSTSWTKAIPFNEKTLIIIDDLTQLSTAKILLEQVQSNPRMKQWKVVVATQSQNTELINIFKNKRLKEIIEVLELKRLSLKSLECLTVELIKSSNKFKDIDDNSINITAKKIAQISDGHPIWIFITFKLYEEKGNLLTLYNEEWEIASDYIKQIKLQIPDNIANKKQVDKFLDWICLFKKIHIDDDQMSHFLQKELNFSSNSELQELIECLITSQLIYETGNIRKIKPSILRQCLLMNRLASNKKSSVEYAKEIVHKITTQFESFPMVNDVINSLDEIETISRLNKQPVFLLNPLIEQLKKDSHGTSKSQQIVLSIIKSCASSRPEEILDICKTIRLHPSEEVTEENFWGQHTIRHSELVLDLPKILLETSRYATVSETRKNILKELLELVTFERDLEPEKWKMIQNDGNRAHSVLEDIIFSGPNFLYNYDDEAFILAQEKLKNLKNNETLRNSSLDALLSIIEPLIIPERIHSTFENNTIYLLRFAIPINSPIFYNRTKILEQIWNLLNKKVSKEIRMFALTVLVNSHTKTINSLGNPVNGEQLKIEAKSNLEKILIFIKSDWITLTELNKARELWQWHLEYDERTEYNSLAIKCESEFLIKPNCELYASIFVEQFRQNQNTFSSAKTLAESFDEDPTGNLIVDFINNGLNFTNRQLFWNGSYLVAGEIARNFESPYIQEFLKKNINSENKDFREFSFLIYGQKLKLLRNNLDQEQQRELLMEASKIFSTSRLKEFILFQYFNFLREKFNIIDLSFIESKLDLLLSNSNVNDKQKLILVFPKFLLCGWDKLISYIEKCLQTFKTEDYSKTIPLLIQSLSEEVYYLGNDFNVLRSNVKWLFSLIVKMTDIGILKNVEWELQQLCERAFFLMSPNEFLEFIESRIQIAKDETNINFVIFPNASIDFFKFVQPFDPDKNDINQFEQTLDRLFAFNNKEYPIGYHLPSWIVKLDPQGVKVPAMIQSRLKALGNLIAPKALIMWSRYAAEYPENSDSWRKIACCAIGLSSEMSKSEREKVFQSIKKKGIESWFNLYGEFHPRWEQAVKDAEENLKIESDSNLKMYFLWKLNTAKNVFEMEKTKHKEEHDDE